MSEDTKKTAETNRPAAKPAKLDPVAQAILSLVAGGGGSPTDVARALAESRRKPSDPPDLWRRYLQAVNEQALFLARQGRIVITRRGKPQNPHKPVKGVLRLAPMPPGGLPPWPADDEDDGDED